MADDAQSTAVAEHVGRKRSINNKSRISHWTARKDNLYMALLLYIHGLPITHFAAF